MRNFLSVPVLTPFIFRNVGFRRHLSTIYESPIAGPLNGSALVSMIAEIKKSCPYDIRNSYPFHAPKNDYFGLCNRNASAPLTMPGKSATARLNARLGRVT